MKTTKSNAAVLKKDATKETKKVGPVAKSQWDYKKSLLYKKGGSTMKYQTKGTVDTKTTDNNKQTMKPSSYIMNQFKKGLMKKANAKKINPATGGMDYTSGDTTTNQRLMERKKGGSTKLAKLAPPYDKVTRADVLKGRGVFKSGGSAHPGFKAVQSSIAKKQGVSKQAAGAILAASTRNASAAAKRANPRLKRVKG